MNIEITKAPIPTNARDTKRGRTKYPFDDLPVVNPKLKASQPCLHVEGENESRLVLLRMRGVARDKKYRFLTERNRDESGRLKSVTIWRIE